MDRTEYLPLLKAATEDKSRYLGEFERLLKIARIYKDYYAAFIDEYSEKEKPRLGPESNRE